MDTLTGSLDSQRTLLSVIESDGYTILKKIDYGSFSDVLQVKNGTGRVFAMKKIESNRPVEDDDDILNEIQCLVRLRHHHVIQIKDFILCGNTACIVMEFAPLGNLQQYVDDKKKISDESLLVMFSQLLSAVEYCHSCDIAHRDLNPSNVLVIGENLVKLADFGLGFSCTEDGTPKLCEEYLGQASYLAPEINKGCPFLPKPADVWSLGCVLFFLYHKNKPFTGSDTTILKTQVQSGLTLPDNFDNMSKIPSLFNSTMKTMCCVNISERPCVSQISQQWNTNLLDECKRKHCS